MRNQSEIAKSSSVRVEKPKQSMAIVKPSLSVILCCFLLASSLIVLPHGVVSRRLPETNAYVDPSGTTIGPGNAPYTGWGVEKASNTSGPGRVKSNNAPRPARKRRTACKNTASYRNDPDCAP
ncbi:hypothetical protein V6N13_026124 [Hibiscus sabdariffa]|uniref:Uncharacterized protein n=1 Tax=Hibiscus sabdariffa TaxID=183260 RepID=A0ABR2A038_9ROSI